MAAGGRQGRRIPRQRLEQPTKRIKFEAIGADSTIYRQLDLTAQFALHRHHFNDQGPSKICPEAIKPYSRTEWFSRLGLAERNAARWRTHPRVASIEILEAMQV
jgi:hypothetical protein